MVSKNKTLALLTFGGVVSGLLYSARTKAAPEPEENGNGNGNGNGEGKPNVTLSNLRLEDGKIKVDIKNIGSKAGSFYIFGVGGLPRNAIQNFDENYRNLFFDLFIATQLRLFTFEYESDDLPPQAVKTVRNPRTRVPGKMLILNLEPEEKTTVRFDFPYQLWAEDIGLLNGDCERLTGKTSYDIAIRTGLFDIKNNQRIAYKETLVAPDYFRASCYDSIERSYTPGDYPYQILSYRAEDIPGKAVITNIGDSIAVDYRIEFDVTIKNEGLKSNVFYIGSILGNPKVPEGGIIGETQTKNITTPIEQDGWAPVRDSMNRALNDFENKIKDLPLVSPQEKPEGAKVREKTKTISMKNETGIKYFKFTLPFNQTIEVSFNGLAAASHFATDSNSVVLIGNTNPNTVGSEEIFRQIQYGIPGGPFSSGDSRRLKGKETFDLKAGEYILAIGLIDENSDMSATLKFNSLLPETETLSFEKLLNTETIKCSPVLASLSIDPLQSNVFPEGVGGAILGSDDTATITFRSESITQEVIKNLIPESYNTAFLDLGIRVGLFEQKTGFKKIDDEVVRTNYVPIQ